MIRLAAIGVAGAGSFGMALAKMFSENGHEVALFSVINEEIEILKDTGRNEKYLKNIVMPKDIKYTCDLNDVLNCDILILAVASKFVRSTAALLKGRLDAKTVVVSVSKGFDPETKKTLSFAIKESVDNDVVILSGPSHAEELANETPTTVVAASDSKNAAEYISNTLKNSKFRIYTNTDRLGVEIGAALKNIIALAVGICDGLKLGDNTKAALMTRGLTEIARLGVKLGANEKTFAGLSGMGDLIVTCMSMHSRNRRAGILIGQGMNADEAIKTVGTVVEGFYAASIALEIATANGVEMPITEQLCRVIYNNMPPEKAIFTLMTRAPKTESEDIWIK